MGNKFGQQDVDKLVRRLTERVLVLLVLESALTRSVSSPRSRCAERV